MFCRIQESNKLKEFYSSFSKIPKSSLLKVSNVSSMMHSVESSNPGCIDHQARLYHHNLGVCHSAIRKFYVMVIIFIPKSGISTLHTSWWIFTAVWEHQSSWFWTLCSSRNMMKDYENRDHLQCCCDLTFNFHWSNNFWLGFMLLPR